MADNESSHLMWVIIVVAIAALIFMGLKAAFPGLISDVTDKMTQGVKGIDIGGNTDDNGNENGQSPDTAESKKTISTTNTLNFDLARHPLTESEIKSMINTLQKTGFKNLNLRLSDKQHLMYKSNYLQNKNSEALTIDQLKSIVNYAKSKSIIIIPDLDSPGHADAILSALKTSHSDIYNKVAMNEGTIDYTTSESLELMKTLYDEVLPAFMGQAAQSFVVGSDEVPGGQDLYSNSLLPFINELGDYINSKGFSPIIWNDAILKKDVSKLSKNYSVFYWSQGTHSPADQMPELVKYTTTVKEYNDAGISVINANDYANTFGLQNIGNSENESYFYNYLENTSNPTLFNEITDNELQWWTPETLSNHGMVVSLWGENSDNISSKQINEFISKIKLPKVPN